MVETWVPIVHMDGSARLPDGEPGSLADTLRKECRVPETFTKLSIGAGKASG